MFIPGQSGWLDVVLRGSVFPASAQAGHYPASAPWGVGQPYPRVWGHTRWKKADTQFKLNIRGFMLRPLAIKYLKILY